MRVRDLRRRSTGGEIEKKHDTLWIIRKFSDHTYQCVKISEISVPQELVTKFSALTATLSAPLNRSAITRLLAWSLHNH